MTTVVHRTPIEELLRRWAEDGVITPDQAERMRGYAEQDGSADDSHHGQLVVEGLGYVGGVTVLAGAMLVGAQYWGDLGTAMRLVVLTTGTLVLFCGGAVLPPSTGTLGDRMRAVLWAVSTGTFSGVLAVWGEQSLDLGDRGLPLLVAAGCAVYAAALWASHSTWLQQIVMMAALALTAAASLHRLFGSDDLPGLGVWGVGIVWVALAWSETLPPRRLGLTLGSATAIFGAMLAASADAGMILTLSTIVAVIVVAVVVRDLVLLGVGAFGALANVPVAMTRWFPDSIAAAVALLVVGSGLVGIAVLIAGRGARSGGAGPGDDEDE